jgi:hypothetical protein
VHEHVCGSNTEREQNEDASQQLNTVIDELLHQLENKFSTISGELLAKSKFRCFRLALMFSFHCIATDMPLRRAQLSIVFFFAVDDMSKRLDSLEATIQSQGRGSSSGDAGK